MHIRLVSWGQRERVFGSKDKKRPLPQLTDNRRSHKTCFTDSDSHLVRHRTQPRNRSWRPHEIQFAFPPVRGRACNPNEEHVGQMTSMHRESLFIPKHVGGFSFGLCFDLFQRAQHLCNSTLVSATVLPRLDVFNLD